ncbi:hypothetical protein DB346_11055 [Verrucomicrobia bacterium LW23]|nr:hypothetical protein DB346_11055 [Verrucomicrobia bacterium LW23]
MGLVVAAVLYVLSIGPVCNLNGVYFWFERYHDPQWRLLTLYGAPVPREHGTIDMIYSPVMFVYRRWPPGKAALDAWLRVCGVAVMNVYAIPPAPRATGGAPPAVTPP